MHREVNVHTYMLPTIMLKSIHVCVCVCVCVYIIYVWM